MDTGVHIRLSALVEMTDGHGEHLLLFAVPAAEITFDPATAVPTSQGPAYRASS